MSPIALIANKGFIIKLFVINLFLCGIQTFAQELSGSRISKKAIEYHDPNNRIRLKENLLLK
jgi:hypothetical protein